MVRQRGFRARAVAVCRPESSVFWMQIIHQIAKDLSARGVNLMYTYLPAEYTQGYTLPASLTDGSVEGVIVLNVYEPPVLQMLAALPLPKVYLDTVPAIPFDALHGDLLLIEGREPIRRITGRLLDRGCTRLGFVGDVNYALTNTDRYRGFLDAFAERGLTPDPASTSTWPSGSPRWTCAPKRWGPGWPARSCSCWNIRAWHRKSVMSRRRWSTAAFWPRADPPGGRGFYGVAKRRKTKLPICIYK